MTAELKSEPPDKTTSGVKTGPRKDKEPKQTYAPRWLFWGSAALVAIVAAIGALYMTMARHIDIDSIPMDVIDRIGVSGARLFVMFDEDKDGYLSVEEFEPLLQSLIGNNVCA